MASKDQWHLDEEGRLRQAMTAQSRNRSDWEALAAANTRGTRAANRLIDGAVVALHFGALVTVGAIVLATLGFIDFPSKGQQEPAPVIADQPALPPIGADVCE